MGQRFKILFVDDEIEYQNLLNTVLGSAYQVQSCGDTTSALSSIQSNVPDLIILDINLPGTNGITFCEQIRTDSKTKHIPILMLTGIAGVDQRVKAFTAGADMFLQKPFTEDELLACVGSMCRRLSESGVGQNILKCGSLELNLDRVEVQIDTKPVALSFLEFNLLKFFVDNKSKVLTRKDILNTLWKGCVITDRTVDSHIASLRRKLGTFDYALVTVHGVGYVFEKKKVQACLDSPLSKSG